MDRIWQVAAGDVVVLRDRNENRAGGPWLLHVEKVGRTRLTVRRYGRPEQYRLEDGTSCGAEGSWVQTLDERDEELARGVEREALRLAGIELRFGGGTFTSDQLRRIRAIVEEVPDHAS